jgi:WD40 repeat protein
VFYCNFHAENIHTKYLFSYFRNKVTALAFANISQQLISGGEDSHLVCWDMTVKRKEVNILKLISIIGYTKLIFYKTTNMVCSY